MDCTLQRIVRTMILTSFTTVAVFGAAAQQARADDAGPGVARISLIKGGVNIKRADSGDTLGAAINAPLGVGDYLSTQPDARTEVQLADRTSLRVGAGTQLRFTNLEAASNALQLAAGTVELRLFGNDAAHPEIDTPNVVVRPTEKGRYRVSVDRDGNTLVTVRSGEADVAAQNTTQTLRAASSLEVSGDASNARVQTVAEIGRDGFDAWNDDRDRYEEAGADYAYVDPAIVGADDLGRYGTWVDEPDYGEVWHPTYAAGWAPYHDGQWVWEPYYGWTWVGAEPWGWAPYHYGRWFYAADEGWCWYPQPVVYEAPVYRPALVAFFSFGGLSFGFGNIGWVPLAPYEPFNPWWGNGYGAPVFNRVTSITNVTNVTNITNINTITNINNYHNIWAPGGMVAVNAANFKAGRFAHLTPVTPKELRAAKVVADILPIVPSRRNLAYAPSTAPVTNAIDAARFKGFKPLAPRFPIRMFAEQQAAVTNVVQRLTSPSEHPAESGGTTHDHATLHAASTWGTARPQPNELSPWDRFAPKAAQSQHRDATGRAAETMRPATLVTHPVNSAWDRFDHVTPSTRPNKSAVEESPRDRAHATTDPFARFDSRSLPKTRANTDQHTGVPPGYEARPASSQGRPASYGSRPPYESHAQPNHDGQRVPSAAHPVVPVPTTPYASHHQ